ncbi:MAG: hypothetical protein SO373_03890 [Candidatus Borkfalkiaceae bacterium]|nr:hypothetical protein [Christensenellaceae bacterium]
MKKATKFDFKTLLVLLLSFTLCFATVFAACSNQNDSSSSSSSSSSEETNYPSDNQLLKNGDFEYTTFTKKDTDFPVYGSSTNWTRGYDSIGSSQAVSNSSKYSDGIIDTADDAYNAIKANKYLPENPRTPEYLGLVDDELYNIADYENGDGKSNEDKLLTSGTKILMIHNKTSEDGQGTARKFTSSSFTLARNQFAKLSVWVKTVDLKSNVFGATYGAYIAIENTISSTAAPLVLKNIDTKGNWAKYTVYLSSSDFSTSAYRMVLGLGFGSAKVVSEYVEGYAFFDNAHMEIIDKTAYETAMGGVATENNVNLNKLDGVTYKTLTEKIVKDQKAQEYIANENKNYTEVVYALSHTRANLNNYSDILTGATAEKNKSERAGDADNAGVVALKDAYSALSFDDKAKLPDADENQNAVFFNFNTSATGYSLTSKKVITVPKKSYLKLSFWMKAEVKSALYSNALTVNVRDLGKTGANETGSNVVSTALVSNDSTKDYENDNYNGWKQYVLFVSNTVGEVDRDFELEFVFGTMDAIDKDEDIRKLTKGYAIVTDLEGYELSADDYSIADTSSYTYAKKVSLSADLPNGATEDEDENESFSFTYSESEKAGMYANGTAESVNGYQFVKAGSNAVGGENDNVYGYNSEEVAGGIINSKYNAGFKVIADLLQTDKTVQAMYLGAKADAVAYGFIGKSAILSANTTTYISVKVYATNGAIANFYLANPNALDRFNILSLNPVDRIDSEKEKNLKKEYVQTYTGTDGAWYTLAYLVSTGNEAVTYRPEFWLGTRDNSASNGTVYFTDYTVTTVEKDQKLFELANSGLKLVEGSEVKYTRIPTTIKYNPVTDETDSSSSGKKEVKEITEEYNAETIYCEYSNAATLVKSYDYTTVDVEHEIDKTTTSSDDSSSSSSSEDSSSAADPSSFNWALQLTSIIIAAVLIVLLVVIMIKNIVEKKNSKKSKSVEFYSRDSREIAGKKALAKKAENEKKAAQADDDEDEEVGEYDYNNPEINNNDKLNSTEETTETTEKTTEETTDGGSEGTEGSDAE